MLIFSAGTQDSLSGGEGLIGSVDCLWGRVYNRLEVGAFVLSFWSHKMRES